VQLQLLFVLDSQTDILYRQDPPNNGTLGNLGINVDADNGFDIGGNSAIVYSY
jgi:hypothetical protein